MKNSKGKVQEESAVPVEQEEQPVVQAEQPEVPVLDASSPAVPPVADKPLTKDEMIALFSKRISNCLNDMIGSKAEYVRLNEERTLKLQAKPPAEMPENLVAEFSSCTPALWGLLNDEQRRKAMGISAESYPPVSTEKGEKAWVGTEEVLNELSVYCKGYRIIKSSNHKGAHQSGTSVQGGNKYSREEIEGALKEYAFRQEKVLNKEGKEVLKSFCTIGGVEHEGYISNWQRYPPVWLEAIMKAGEGVPAEAEIIVAS
jgi:hypothetical protein